MKTPKPAMAVILQDTIKYYKKAIADLEVEMMRHEAMGRHNEQLATWRALHYLQHKKLWAEQMLAEEKQRGHI